jgi:hypothetical protein
MAAIPKEDEDKELPWSLAFAAGGIRLARSEPLGGGIYLFKKKKT